MNGKVKRVGDQTAPDSSASSNPAETEIGDRSRFQKTGSSPKPESDGWNLTYSGGAPCALGVGLPNPAANVPPDMVVSGNIGPIGQLPPSCKVQCSVSTQISTRENTNTGTFKAHKNCGWEKNQSTSYVWRTRILHNAKFLQLFTLMPVPLFPVTLVGRTFQQTSNQEIRGHNSPAGNSWSNSTVPYIRCKP
jgi:hypothetical protein